MKRFHRAIIICSLLPVFLSGALAAAEESRYFVRVGDEPTLSDLLYELEIGRIYGRGRLLETTVEINPNKKPTRGDLIYRGDRIYIPLDDPQKLPPSFRILESGEIIRNPIEETPPSVVQDAPQVVAPSESAAVEEPVSEPVAEIGDEPARKYWIQGGYGQRTATEKIGNVKTVMEGLSVLPEASAGIHFYLNGDWFSGLSGAVSNPLTFLAVDMPLLYSFEIYGGRERVAKLGKTTTWSPAAIGRYGADAHITPDASSGTASAVSYLDRETRSWEIGMRNCLRFTESADGTSLCLDVTRIISATPQSQVNRLALSKLSGWGFETLFLYPLNSSRTIQAVGEARYSISSSGSNSLRSFGGILGVRYNFFD